MREIPRSHSLEETARETPFASGISSPDGDNYFGMMIFGREINHSVASPEVFTNIVYKLQSVFDAHSIRSKSRGRISDSRGRNIAPRTGFISARTMDVWVKQLKNDKEQSFERFELFGPSWDNQSSLIYCALEKFQRVSPNSDPHDAHAGAGNSITVAVHQSVLAMNLAEFENLAKNLVPITSGFYGYLNPTDAWDYSVGTGKARGWMMDIRSRDIIAHKYRRYGRRMTEAIPDLYRGNILSGRHIPESSLKNLSKSKNIQIEDWPMELSYVRFAKDPQTDVTFFNSVAMYFNLVATERE
jgi:hypothetical protein